MLSANPSMGVTFSVILPTRNRPDQLERALKSVLAQTVTDFELLVGDDSDFHDPSNHVEHIDSRVRHFRNGIPLGASNNRNSLVRQARGELVAFLDDDDWWEPNFLATQGESLAFFPQAVLSFCGYQLCDVEGNITWPALRPMQAYRSRTHHLLAEMYIHSMSLVVIRRKNLLQVGDLDPQLRCLHDIDLYRRLISEGSFCYISAILVHKQVNEGSLSSDLTVWRLEERAWFAALGLAQESFDAQVRSCRALLFCSKLWLAEKALWPCLCLFFESLVADPLTCLRLLINRARVGHKKQPESFALDAALEREELLIFPNCAS
jgi:glycosyltransferase involved in cell wall biosynthesis